MLEDFQAGGPVMYPILLCSIIALAVWLERQWSLRKARIVPYGFCVELLALLRGHRWDDALVACRKRPAAIARVVEAAIEARRHGRARLSERVEEAGRREAAEMERFVPVLSIVATVAPLLGLLGTVGGIILTFREIGAGGMGNMNQVGAGIAVALNTTFFGLVVAIPAVIMEKQLLTRVDRLTLDLEEVASEAVDLLSEPEHTL